MFSFDDSPVAVRADIREVAVGSFAALASPGAALHPGERVAVAAAARGQEIRGELYEFARLLYADPGAVHAPEVETVAESHGYPQAVEVIGIVSRLSSIDRFHLVLGMELQPLPEPGAGEPTGHIRTDLKKRRAHVPMPPGAIPVALDLVPEEGVVTRSMFGPMYMTEEEMADPFFHRDPGLNTPQLETVAARISLINRCFY